MRTGTEFRSERKKRFDAAAEKSGTKRSRNPNTPADWTIAWVARKTEISADLISLYERTGRATPGNTARLWAIFGEEETWQLPRTLDEALVVHVPNKIDIRTSGDPETESDSRWQAAVPYLSLMPVQIRLDPLWPDPVELQSATVKIPAITGHDTFDWFFFTDLSPQKPGFHNIEGRVVPTRIAPGHTFLRDVIFHCERLRGQLRHIDFLAMLRQSRSDPVTIEVEYKLASTRTRDTARKSFRVYVGRDNIEKCFAFSQQRGRDVPRWMQIVPFHRGENVDEI